jgi:MFS family permease
VLAACSLGGVASAFAMWLVPPLLPHIMSDFEVGLGTAGLAMTIFAIAGVLLNMPAGWLVKRYGWRFLEHGLKAGAVLAMLATTVGCACSALADAYPTFLLGRVLQGIGFTAIVLVGRTAAGLWFPPDRVSLALWLVGAAIGVGGVAAMVGVPWIASAAGPAAAWWTGASMSLLALVAVALFVRMPPWLLVAAGFFAGPLTSATAAGSTGVGQGYAKRTIWLLAIALCLLTIPVAAVVTFAVASLHEVHRLPLGVGGWVGACIMAGWLAGSAVPGPALSRVGYRRALGAAGMAMIVLVSTGSLVTGPWIPIWAFLLGGIGLGLAQRAGFAAVPGIMVRTELASVGVGICTLGIGIAWVVAPPLFGSAVSQLGWTASGLLLVPFVLLALGALLLMRDRPRLASRQ